MTGTSRRPAEPGALDGPRTGGLPKSLAANPLLSAWIRLPLPGRVTILTGKVELGQGIATVLTQIAAEELGVEPSRIDLVRTRTDRSPHERFTSGSQSVAESGTAIRHVCREVRTLATTAVAAGSGVDVTKITVVDGRFCGPDGRELATYWSVADSLPLDRPATRLDDAEPGPVAPSPVRLPRVDLPDKVFGRPRFVHDLAFPGMVHGRVVRPPGRAARLLTVDVDEVTALPGVLDVVVEGTFVGVVADRESRAVSAAVRLAQAARWTGPDEWPDQTNLADWLVRQPTDDDVVAASEPGPTLPPDAYQARYFRPMVAHASVAPSCAVAHWTAGSLHVWTHSQGVFELRDALSAELGLAPEQVVVEHVEGAGCYGHNGADDVAADAALLALRIRGRPVRVQWSRADELGWAPFGSAMVADVRARVQDGMVTDWTHDVWSNGHSSRPGYAGTPGLLGPAHRRGVEVAAPSIDPPIQGGHGSARNADPGYAFERRRVTTHRLRTMPIRTSALRSLGAFLNVFAIESTMDDLAREAGRDPLEFRLAHLPDERARAVLEVAADAAGWGTPVGGDDAGRGLAYARYKNLGAYCAVVAEVEAVDRVRVTRLVVAVDVGRVVSLDGVRNQIEGGAIQATSWTLLEQVTFGDGSVTSTDWERYPILRFGDVPHVEVHVLDRPQLPSVGAGEAVQGPVPAAVANALYDAIGVRVRELPLTRENVFHALDPK